MGPVTSVLSRTAISAARRFCSYAFLVLFIAFYGCGDAEPVKYPVSGFVTYRGKPLPNGNVMFLPDAGGKAALSTIKPDGSYFLEATAGKHRVGVTAIPQPQPGTNPDPLNYEHKGSPPPLIPAKYGRPDTSGLVVEVREGENTSLDINLPP